jgi:hypothetical protein
MNLEDKRRNFSPLFLRRGVFIWINKRGISAIKNPIIHIGKACNWVKWIDMNFNIKTSLGGNNREKLLRLSIE